MIVIFYDDIVQDISSIGQGVDIIFDIISWADELLEEEEEPDAWPGYWNIRSQFE